MHNQNSPVKPLPPGISPLRQAHCDSLDCIIQQTPPKIQLARCNGECGLDMSEQIRELEAQLTLARNLKAAHFSGM